MRMIRKGTPAIVLALAVGFTSMAVAQTKDDPAPKADNTKTNKRKDDAPTADQQKNNKSDVDVTAEIRRAVMDDKSLSVYAHNVKIIAQDGMVTLKGPVRSEAEKTTIEQKAAAVVGQAKVKNLIEIAP